MMCGRRGRSDPDNKKKKGNHPDLGRVQSYLLLSIYSGFLKGSESRGTPENRLSLEKKTRHAAKKVKKPTQTRGVYWTIHRHLL